MPKKMAPHLGNNPWETWAICCLFPPYVFWWSHTSFRLESRWRIVQAAKRQHVSWFRLCLRRWLLIVRSVFFMYISWNTNKKLSIIKLFLLSIWVVLPCVAFRYVNVASNVSCNWDTLSNCPTVTCSNCLVSQISDPCNTGIDDSALQKCV